MIVAPGAYLIVIPDVCKNPSVPFRRHSGRPAKIRALPFVVIPDARSAIRNRLQSPSLSPKPIPGSAHLRVSGPGMTTCVDARAITRVLPRSSFRTRSAIRNRLPQSGCPDKNRSRVPRPAATPRSPAPSAGRPDKNRSRVPSAGDAYQQRPFELAEVSVGSGDFWPVLSMLSLPHLSSACAPCGVAVAV